MTRNLTHIVDSRWFAWAELAAVLFACGLWYGWPQVGWWPLPMALLPGAVRVANGRFPWQRTWLDPFLLLFGVTAVIGVWAAYDPETAVAKFWVLVGAILLYYALAAQPRANLWPVAGLLVGLGLLLTIHFALSHDWQADPARLGLVDRWGLWLMTIRPSTNLRPILDNSVGGMVAMLIPLSLALIWQSWHRKRPFLLLLTVSASGLLLAGLFLSATRGAWLALAAALLLWFAWSGSRYLGMPRQTRLWLLGGAVIVVAVGLLLLTAVAPQRIIEAANALPGAPTGTSRYTLAYDTLFLVADYPWTGAGLGSFSGLYAHYILGTPFFVYSYSHNFYLDLLLEQGMAGFLAVVGMMALTAWLLLRPTAGSELRPLRQALLISLVVVALHGLVDSALYAVGGSPLLFAWAGLALALVRSEPVMPAVARSVRRRQPEMETAVSPQTVLVLALVVTLLFGVWVSRDSLRASWYANRGAVEMARIELADFPAEAWDDGTRAAQLDPVVPLLQQALVYNERDVTARHRLGLIALGQRDFETAVIHLQVAHQLQPTHRGIAKTLGYSYLWSGQLERAGSLLYQLPETFGELEAYVWWWQVQGRDDLAQLAQRLRRGGGAE